MSVQGKTPAVEVCDLKVRFGSFTAVDGIDFEVRAGEIFGFLGANGAGKTTTIRCLCGLLIPTGGRVLVGGADVAKDPTAVKSIVGYMSQKFTLYSDLTIEENLNFAASLRKLDRSLRDRRIRELYGLIDLKVPGKTMVRDLPGGILQQVALVAAMLHDPSIIFLDEPTAGVTPANRALFWDLIGKISAEGRTVFVTTHYMDESERCDRIALMRSGKIIALGSPSELKEQTFPEPVYELTPPERPDPEWLTTLKADPFIDSIQPYGMRYHVRTNDAAKWGARCEKLEGFEIRRIEPSMEDVFIKRVEGEGR